MIARPLEFEPERRVRPAPRTARSASDRRRARSTRRRYAIFGQILVTVGAVLACVVVYLALMANVTRLNYELSRSTQERIALLDDAARLEDQLASLRSRERLARIAAKFEMREPAAFVAIAAPSERELPPAGGLAFLAQLK